MHQVYEKKTCFYHFGKIRNVIPTLIAKSIRDFQIIIATGIPIENHSGKTGNRFSFQIRSAIFRSKTDPDLHFKIDPRLKNRPQRIPTVGAKNRDPIFVRKSISDFRIKIGSRFLFLKSISDFQITIAIAIPVKK
jgi:hypothetical protein